jgi:PAS domain S-box-containing protein
MALEPRIARPRETTPDRSGERLAYLERIKSFQDEMVKIIRVYTSQDSFTSERCLQEIVNFIARKFEITLVSVFLLDDPPRDLSVHVAGGDQRLSPLVKGFHVSLGSGLSGQCAKSGEMILANDVAQDARYVPGPIEGVRSEMSVPIRIKHRIVGVLDLQDVELNRFPPDFAPLMEEIVLNIGFVLETRQLTDDLRRSNDQLERKVTEKVDALRKSEERYRAIVENAADPIFMIDPEGHFTWMNGATSSHLGFPRSELQGMNISRIVKKGYMHKFYLLLRDALDGKEVKPIQLEVLTKTGEERTVEFACVGIRDNGRASGAEGTLRDITDRVVIDKLKKNYMKSLEEAVVERTSEIKETQRAAILAIANLAESIDDDTGGHLQRIRTYSKVLAEELRAESRYKDSITEEYSEMIYDLSPLHDLGKVGIRDYILQKPDKLTPEEFEKMKDHAEIGARALRMAGEMIHRESIFSIGEMIARFHHEKWDGSGYPAVEINGETRPLRGEEIPLCARIVALADVYDALTSKRPYKMPFPHEKARDMIMAQTSKHFDPEVVQAFVRREQDFIKIRNQFPDTHIPEGRPFELPARDRS